MHEHQRPAGLEDPDSSQQIGRICGLELVEASDTRSLQQVALLEDRQRSGKLARVVGQPEELQVNRATNRFSTASDAFLAQCYYELAHEERRPTR
jgi:hypothetical protein